MQCKRIHLLNTYSLDCSQKDSFLRCGNIYSPLPRKSGGFQMGKKQRKSAQSVSDDSNNLSLNIRRTAVSLAVAAALPGAMMAPQVAMAQDDGDDEVIEEIITTGYRSSLANSIAQKRDATSIVETISAEDIGKLPDASIGESP